ncbi:MAG TPA: hypothetical protein VJK25_00350 [Patescibacteria group bacterium]|nr:hypothetical protein [Patescibacteria group bacterium]
MYDQINEPVEVVASFKQNEIMPKFFVWRRKMYKVDKVHLVHTSRQGSHTLFHFSITGQNNYFQLVFNPFTLTWILASLYNNG